MGRESCVDSLVFFFGSSERPIKRPARDGGRQASERAGRRRPRPDQRACVGRDPPGGDTVRSTQPLQVGLPAMSEVILEEANGSSTASQMPVSE